MKLRLYKEILLDILYPRSLYCLKCRCRLPNTAVHGLCPVCCSTLPFIQPPLCSLCGKPIQELGQIKCPDCLRYAHVFDAGCCVFEYTPSVQELIYRYKYYGEVSLARTFAYFMTEAFCNAGWSIDYILPVPLHISRLHTRGYNQAALLADYMGDFLHLPCKLDILVRQKDTPTQTRLSRKERTENLHKVFKVTDKRVLADKNLLLIDDIYTTGATVDSCSQILKESDAAKVYVLTLATGKSKL